MFEKLLPVKPDTEEYVRKLYNLDRPEKLEQAIQILEKWIDGQNHYVKKKYERKYLEITLYDTKGSIEKAKEKLEKRCIFRTILPKYFEYNDIKSEYSDFLSKNIVGAPLPKLTPEHYRVIPYKMFEETFDTTNITDFFTFSFMINEFLKLYDCSAGYVFLIDMSDTPIMNLIAKLKINEFRHWIAFLLILRQSIFEMTKTEGTYPLKIGTAWYSIQIFQEAQGLRLKHLIYVTPSKSIDVFLKIVKPILSKKMQERIKVFKDMKDVYDIIPREVLPVELGGTERSYKDIQEDWLNFLSEKKNLDFLNEMGRARIDENIKKINKNDNFVESTGSFVSLEFD